jgi:hypothetical protein
LRQATEDLQKVAMNIQYLGLSRDEVEALFTMTEAEEALSMRQGSDASQLRNDLDKVMRMVTDVRFDMSSATSGETGGLMLDFNALSLDFGTGIDFTALFGGTSSSISRQRGEDLFRSANNRCQRVLTDCRAQGVDTRVITGNYDLEIDRQCVAYERSLQDANTNMRRTVMNAENVLRTARLQVSRNQNQFDARGCINALDSCMQNDFVCGRDFENCLDPTGRFIVNGRIVLGSSPGGVSGATVGTGVFDTWLYSTAIGTSTGRTNNPWNAGSLTAMIGLVPGNAPSDNKFPTVGAPMLGFMLNKIGVVDNEGRAHGMCASVLNRCQSVTRTGTGRNTRYKPDNMVVTEFLSRAFIQIRAGQDMVISSFAENCVQDVRSCLIQNNLGGISGNADALQQVAMNACDSLARSCQSVSGISGSLTDYMRSIYATAMGGGGAGMTFDVSCTTAAIAVGFGQCVTEGYRCLPSTYSASGVCLPNSCPANSTFLDFGTSTETNGTSTTQSTIRRNNPAVHRCRCINNGAYIGSVADSRTCP